LQYRVKIETYLIAVQHARSIGRDRGWGGSKKIDTRREEEEERERMNFTLQKKLDRNFLKKQKFF
jgi:hypothetical protein